MRRLDIGSGDKPYRPDDEEWFHLDARHLSHIEYVVNIRDRMPFPEDHWDELRAYSVLEHIEYRLVPFVLREWQRILKPGGFITIVVPYIDGILRGRAANMTSDKDFMGYLGGEQDYPENYHLSHFDRKLLDKRLTDAGFKNIEFLDAFEECPLPDMCVEMRVRAWK